MSLLTRIKRILGYRSHEQESEYVCIACGAELDLNHRNCPECKKPFVAPLDDAGE